jgi:hypothetical protein
MSIFSSGQKNVGAGVLINGSSDIKGAYLYFLLTRDRIELDNPDLFVLLRQNADKRLFYCVYNDQMSRIYDLETETLEDKLTNFQIPDPLFYRNLYKTKVCPFCHKDTDVIPFIYGKPASALMERAKNGEVKLGGCSKSQTSPVLYCKTDKLKF